MSKHASSSSTSYGAWALAAWLVALALFLIWLGWVLFSTSPIERKAEKPSLPGVAQSDPGTVLDSLPAKGSLATPNMPFTTSQEYVLTGAGLQGFYQTSAPNDVWTLSYPEPQLNAQVIKRGPPVPEIVTQGVDVTWELGPQAGVAKDSTTRQGRMNVVEDSFFAASIPVSAVNADGVLNPYPVITLRAKDEKTGKLLAESAAVLAVSPGFGCAQCHANAGTAILEVHDRHQSTHFMEQHAKGGVIACRSCHVGLKGGKAGEGKSGPELSVSAAIHGWHATYLADRGADACKTCHVDLGRTGDDPKDAPRRLFARDFHVDRGLSCVRCHGFMEDHSLALLKAEQEAGLPQAAKLMSGITAREVPLDKIKGHQLPQFLGKAQPAHRVGLQQVDAQKRGAVRTLQQTPRRYAHGALHRLSRRATRRVSGEEPACRQSRQPPASPVPATGGHARELRQLCVVPWPAHGLFGAPSLGAVERKGNTCAFRSVADHAPGPVLPSGAYAADQLHHLPSHGIRGRQVPPVHEFRMP